MSIRLVKRYVCVVGWRNKRKKNANSKEEQTWTTNEEKKRKKEDKTYKLKCIHEYILRNISIPRYKYCDN